MKTRCWECGVSINIDIESKWLDNVRQYGLELCNPPKRPWKRFYCEDCADNVKTRFKEEKESYIQLKTKMIQERAIGILEKQGMDLYKYEEAIKAVQEFSAEHPDKFDSSYEMIAAIILIQNKIKAKLQYKIDRYRVDFYLPDLTCVLEIDGERHKHKMLEDSNRDIKIRQILGQEWEVVRVGTEYLEKNAKALPRAIIELKKLKQTTRKNNNGIIPSHFSKRDKAKSKEVERIAKSRNEYIDATEE